MTDIIRGDTPGKDGPVVMPSFLDPNANTKLIDFVNAKPSSQRPQKMISLPTVGACTNCRTAGSFDVPFDFNFTLGDKMMTGKVIKAFCPTCRSVREMRTLAPEELTDNQFLLMRRYYEIYKQLVVDGTALPFEARQFVDAYEQRLEDKRKAYGIGRAAPELVVPASTPPPPPEPPKIFVP